MCNYPDTNKLMFFSDNQSDDEYEFDSDDSDFEEMEALKAAKVPLQQLIEDENISQVDKQLILGILTWSIKDRLTIPKVFFFWDICR